MHLQIRKHVAVGAQKSVYKVFVDFFNFMSYILNMIFTGEYFIGKEALLEGV
jgi:hypothetical protein